MATGRNRLAALTGDDTFQFTFSVPVPKFQPPTYQRSEKPEPSSDNSTPDSSCSQLLFSLIPESHDGDGSDESEIADEEKGQEEDDRAHHESHAKESPEELMTTAAHPPKASSGQVVVRRLRTRSVIVSDDAAQKPSRKTTAKRKPIQRKRKADPNDENSHQHLSNAPTTDEDDVHAAAKDEDKAPPTKVRRSWKSRYTDESSERVGLKETNDRYSFTKGALAAASEIKQDHHDDHSYSTENSLLEMSHHEHSRLEISQLEDSGIENSLEISQLEESKIETSHLADSHLEFRSGYDYFVGVSEEENDDYGYHGSDEHEGSGVGHILDASDALKLIKQRRQERLSKTTNPPPQVDSCESLPPSSLPPAKAERMVPTSKSEDFCYVDSDCEEPPPPDARNDEDGRKLVYVFRGQRYFTDVDLTEIPWAAADSEDEDDLQQIRFKPRVLWPDHPEDANSRIKLRDTPVNSRLL
ncbi:hypothetical protein K450DRAFT_255178 [Umbelopsis ramanniana AG]|uniref:Uncharacterized protein n=1 Tax=Umbelopsis ramanniana AG TaxID=1314678 RepID=A0AAD5HBH0_UMBRA|nr:uncharacterized protein K450DRAFT_255178 [Umbelopsis ramanniana AG]KAI8576824.1 hypothetical protein K450DRAFT_255178 [Umbelopsis ramanniana AG]